MTWIKKFLEYWADSFTGEKDTFTGAILPTVAQLEELPAFDEFVATANTVDWKPLDITKVPKYPVYSQNGSSSCVAMSVALIATILYKLRTNTEIMFSASWIYQQRINKPSEGMIGTDAFNIASKGLLPEIMMLSQDLTESQIQSVPIEPWFSKIAEVLAFEDALVRLPIKDIEVVASVIQTTKKPVNVWFEFRRDEWTSIPFVGSFYPNLRHSVVAIDYGMYQNEKAVAIQESWGVGATQFGVLRIIKESFFSKRNVFSAYPRRFKFIESTGDKPRYDGVTIVSAQKCLQYEGLFPTNVDFFESLGPTTRKSLSAFQLKYRLPVTQALDLATKNKLHEIYP